MKVHELITAPQVMPPNDEVRYYLEGPADELVPILQVLHESAHGEHYVLIV